MRRYGPLIVVDGALAVGDPGRHHLRLTPDAVIIREGVSSAGILSWDTIGDIRIDVPTTRFRLPGLVSTVLLGALTVLALDDIGADPENGIARLLVDGERRVLPLSRHHVGGYWAPTVDGAHRLLAQLIAHPDQRTLLAHPEPLVDLAARLARTGRSLR